MPKNKLCISVCKRILFCNRGLCFYCFSKLYCNFLTCNFLNSELNFVGCVWLWCNGYSLLSDPWYNKGLTNALVIQLAPYCQSVLADMLAKTRVSAGFNYSKLFSILPDLSFLKSDWNCKNLKSESVMYFVVVTFWLQVGEFSFTKQWMWLLLNWQKLHVIHLVDHVWLEDTSYTLNFTVKYI